MRAGATNSDGFFWKRLMKSFSMVDFKVGVIFRNLGHVNSFREGHGFPFKRRLHSRPASNSQLPQPLPRLQRFIGLGITLDDVAKFRDPILLLAQFN